MADDFVNNFGLLGQVLFRKRNDREARQKLDEALSRELAKIAAQAGYEKEMVDTRERGAKERVEMGETGANTRLDRELTAREKAEQARREQALAQYVLERQANVAELDMKYAAENKLAENRFNRERPLKDQELSVAEQEAAARSINAATGWINSGEDLTDAVGGFLRIPGRSNAPASPLDGTPAKGGRFPVSRRDGTPPSAKPGETPRSPDNAAPQVPVQVGPKPLNSGVSIIGGDKATLQGGPDLAQPSFMDLMKQSAQYERPQSSLPDSSNIGPTESIGAGMLDSIRGNTWGVGPGTKNIEALLEAYLQKSSPAIKK